MVFLNIIVSAMVSLVVSGYIAPRTNARFLKKNANQARATDDTINAIDKLEENIRVSEQYNFQAVTELLSYRQSQGFKNIEKNKQFSSNNSKLFSKFMDSTNVLNSTWKKYNNHFSDEEIIKSCKAFMDEVNGNAENVAKIYFKMLDSQEIRGQFQLKFSTILGNKAINELYDIRNSLTK